MQYVVHYMRVKGADSARNRASGTSTRHARAQARESALIMSLESALIMSKCPHHVIEWKRLLLYVRLLV